MIATARPYALALLILAALAIVGCGASDLLLAYTGGGLPPGEPDLGGIVVAAVDDGVVNGASLEATQGDVPPGTEPIEGASVTLLRGRMVVGRAVTGEGGYFRFERPDTGSYTIVVTPPAGAPYLRGTEQQVSHTRGQRTFVTIELEHVAQSSVGQVEDGR